jgi:hypothetical protein
MFSVALGLITTNEPLWYAVAQLVEVPEGRGFDSRWSHWNFSVI